MERFPKPTFLLQHFYLSLLESKLTITPLNSINHIFNLAGNGFVITSYFLIYLLKSFSGAITHVHNTCTRSLMCAPTVCLLFTLLTFCFYIKYRIICYVMQRVSFRCSPLHQRVALDFIMYTIFHNANLLRCNQCCIKHNTMACTEVILLSA